MIYLKEWAVWPADKIKYPPIVWKTIKSFRNYEVRMVRALLLLFFVKFINFIIMPKMRCC